MPSTSAAATLAASPSSGTTQATARASSAAASRLAQRGGDSGALGLEVVARSEADDEDARIGGPGAAASCA